jgi:hypothetical protein
MAWSTHTVTVTEDGFEYDGASYASLTKIADKIITGSHLSGRAFRASASVQTEPERR